MTVRDLLRQKGSKVITAQPDDTVLDAVNTMVANKVGAVLVVDKDNKAVGMFTERDLMRVVAKCQNKTCETKVRDAMTADLIICYMDDKLEAVEAVMTEERVRHMPAMDEGNLAGMVSIGDIVKATLSNISVEAHHLRDYIMGKY